MGIVQLLELANEHASQVKKDLTNASDQVQQITDIQNNLLSLTGQFRLEDKEKQ